MFIFHNYVLRLFINRQSEGASQSDLEDIQGDDELGGLGLRGLGGDAWRAQAKYRLHLVLYRLFAWLLVHIESCLKSLKVTHYEYKEQHQQGTELEIILSR